MPLKILNLDVQVLITNETSVQCFYQINSKHSCQELTFWQIYFRRFLDTTRKYDLRRVFFRGPSCFCFFECQLKIMDFLAAAASKL